MPMTSKELITHYTKKQASYQQQINHLEGLNTVGFPLDQMEVYRQNLSKYKKDLAVINDTVEKLNILMK